MASTKDLKKRITSVKNTQQTTKAMKMVSAAKLRRAQDAILNHRPYAKRIGALIQRVASLVEPGHSSPLVARPGLEAGAKKKVLLVMVTSDRGLCGGFNGNIIKTASRWVAAQQESYASIELAFVGRRGFDFFKNKAGYTIGTYFAELGGKVTFDKGHKLADAVLEKYLSGAVHEVKFVYNEFKNVMSQRVVVEDFLPLNQLPPEAEQEAIAEAGLVLARPSLDEVLEDLLAKHFSIQTFRIMLESQAGEHGARMTAMENATRNSGEMIRKLTLQFNRQRQAGITKELLEIIGGSESQKNAEK